jgi:hypothetical protein
MRAAPVTAEYGSLLSAGSGHSVLRFEDRVAMCPACGMARRIDVNGLLYTHLSGEVRREGSELMCWEDCGGSGQAIFVSRCSGEPEVVIPDELTTLVRVTQRDNLYRLKHLQLQIQIHKDYWCLADEVVRSMHERRMAEHRRSIEDLWAEFDLLSALLAA